MCTPSKNTPILGNVEGYILAAGDSWCILSDQVLAILSLLVCLLTGIRVGAAIFHPICCDTSLCGFWMCWDQWNVMCISSCTFGSHMTILLLDMCKDMQYDWFAQCLLHSFIKFDGITLIFGVICSLQFNNNCTFFFLRMRSTVY